MNELWLPSKSTPVIPNFSHKLRDSETLPSGATTIRTFDIEQLAQEQNAVFSIHPDEEVPESLSDDFAAITRIARIRFPLKRLDVITTRETFTAGNPESFRTSQIGIHYDGFEDGFFVLSTDEPTMFYDNREGDNPRQAKPGALVYVPKDCWHSSPNPTHDGERVRIKIIPQTASTERDRKILDLSKITLTT